MILKQKYFLASREFTLTDSEINAKYKTLKEHKEWTIKLDEIGNEILYRSFPKTPGYIAASVMGLFIIVLTLAFILDKGNPDIKILIVNYLIWIPLALFFLLKPAKKEIHILGGKYSLSFFQDRPNKEELKNFIDALLNSSKIYILEKYGKIDSDLPEATQMNILNWLKSRDIISQEKYEDLKHEYKIKKIL